MFSTPLRFVLVTSCFQLRFAPLSGYAGVPARWGNFVFSTPLRFVYSLEEAYLYSPQGFCTFTFLQPSGLIRFNDLFHEGVSYDVLLVKFHDGDAADVLQPLDGIAQP